MDPRLLVLGVILAVVTSAKELPQDALAKRVISSASNALGFDLFEAVSASMERRGNAVLSPLSVSAALALVLQGAGGRTAQQLAATLHLADATEAAKGYKMFFHAIKNSEQVVLNIANAVFSDKNFPVKQSFRDQADSSFRSEIREVLFKSETEMTRKGINEWVSNATRGNIQELFPAGELDSSALMVILNAIYFKGNWASPFHENSTRDMPFQISETEHVLVPTMSDAVELGFTIEPELNASVIQLYYNDNATKMIIFVPHSVDGLETIEKNLKMIDLRALNFDNAIVQLQLPKFKIASSLKLKESLMKLGIIDLFDGNTANLTQLTELSGIFASKVLHKAVVEVSEKGTEAAAATGIELVDRFGALFQVDKPFIFMIVDENNTILFLGRVANPIAE